jgi:hypothetical protein
MRKYIVQLLKTNYTDTACQDFEKGMQFYGKPFLDYGPGMILRMCRGRGGV